MAEIKLIAEIADNQIRYIICEQDDKAECKILNKKISDNNAIVRGKVNDFDLASKKIDQDIKALEKESGKNFNNISLIINEPDIFCTNISGFKKLNGSKVEKRDLDYILNEAKSSIAKNQEKNSILHILNSNFILDKNKQDKIPLDLHGDQLGLHMTFISLPTNNLKNIRSLFDINDLTVDRVISKPFAHGINLILKKENLNNSVVINFDKELSNISLYEENSLIFLKTFNFGTNSIYRDINQLCSLKEHEIKRIIREIDLSLINSEKSRYIDEKFFTDSHYKKLSTKHLNEIINSRVNEMINYIFNKNKNLDYINGKIITIFLIFEDENIFESLKIFFIQNFHMDKQKTQIKSSVLNKFSALSGASELIFKGWPKEAIPFNHRKKSLISSFFERFF